MKIYVLRDASKRKEKYTIETLVKAIDAHSIDLVMDDDGFEWYYLNKKLAKQAQDEYMIDSILNNVDYGDAMIDIVIDEIELSRGDPHFAEFWTERISKK